LRFEVSERANYLGEIQKSLDENLLDSLKQELIDEKVESLAICFLFSFANPTHEKILEDHFTSLGIPISASYKILPQFREYERTSTTVINAYVSPVMNSYLQKLSNHIQDPDSLQVMQSNGGMISPGAAGKEAVRCILSGPAGGVVGMKAIADQVGLSQVIGFDMGGTSTDVSLVDDEAQISTDNSVAGFPVHIPMLSIHTVGAGGGSIAWIDAGGGLQVGPQSAGADPGPACYGKGDWPTVTDANLILGTLQEDHFLDGAMKLELQRSRAAFQNLANKLGLSIEECALGVINIANAHMARALRVISVEKGYDPRDFSLISFGGAGGLHAVALARELGIRQVIIPPQAATLSAFGMLMADVVKDYSQTVMLPGTVDQEILYAAISPLLKLGEKDLACEGFDEISICLEPSLDIRYAGQSFELNVQFSENFGPDFHATHQNTYGYSNESLAIEVVNVRVRGIGRVKKPEIAPQPNSNRHNLREAIIRFVDLFTEAGWNQTPMFDFRKLEPGHKFEGPALVVCPDSTVYLPTHSKLKMDGFRNLMIEAGN
jgi:N-methylhydantoinase A